MTESNEMIDKLLERHKADLELSLENQHTTNEQKAQIKHELEGIDKFGIHAVGSFIFFNAGDVIRLTIAIGNTQIVRDAEILLFSESHVVLFDIHSNSLFQVLKHNIIMAELLDICDDDFYNYLEVDSNNRNQEYETKGGNSYG